MTTATNDPALPTFTAPIDAARVSFLELMIPQLFAGGFTELAARYSVERDRLVARRDAN